MKRVIAGCFLALALAGCTNTTAPWAHFRRVPKDFSSPSGVVRTLAAAMADKGPAGRLAWLDALADSTGPATRRFVAFPDPEVLAAWQEASAVPVPDPWTIENEAPFYDRFASLDSGDYTMVFEADATSPADMVDEVAGSALLHRRYYVAATTPNTTRIIAIGYADLYLVKYQFRWFVVRWQDRLDPLIGVHPADLDHRTLGWRRLESAAS